MRAVVIDALAVNDAVCDALMEEVLVFEGVPDCVAVDDAVADAGTNATLWYSTVPDEGPRIEVQTAVNVSYRTTWLPAKMLVKVVVYSTNRCAPPPSGYSN